MISSTQLANLRGIIMLKHVRRRQPLQLDATPALARQERVEKVVEDDHLNKKNQVLKKDQFDNEDQMINEDRQFKKNNYQRRSHNGQAVD